MKLPNQSQPVLRTGMESMKSNAVNPSSVCTTACSLLPWPASSICKAAC